MGHSCPPGYGSATLHTDDAAKKPNLPGGVILLCELGEDVDEVVVEIRELEKNTNDINFFRPVPKINLPQNKPTEIEITCL